MKYRLYKIPKKDIENFKNEFYRLDYDLKNMIEGNKDIIDEIIQRQEYIDDYLLTQKIVEDGEIENDYVNQLSIDYGLVLNMEEIKEIVQKEKNEFTKILSEMFDDECGIVIQVF